MIFDELCKVIELSDKRDSVEGILREAALFVIENRTLKEGWNSVPKEFGTHVFFLPFEYCAFIPYDNVCMILMDGEKDDKGMIPNRGVVIFTRDNSNHNYILHLGEIRHSYEEDEDNNTTASSEWLTGGIQIIDVEYKESTLFETTKEFAEATSKEFYDSYFEMIKDGIDLIFYTLCQLHEPKNFLMETAPAKMRKTNSKKIPRSHQRPQYTILKPNKARKKMGLPIPSEYKGGKKRPHERRRHERFLSDDKYKWGLDGKPLDKQIIPYGPRAGQAYYKKIMVPSIWIGPSQVRKGNKIYRVIL